MSAEKRVTVHLRMHADLFEDVSAIAQKHYPRLSKNAVIGVLLGKAIESLGGAPRRRGGAKKKRAKGNGDSS
jgi:hypothetical protein